MSSSQEADPALAPTIYESPPDGEGEDTRTVPPPAGEDTQTIPPPSGAATLSAEPELPPGGRRVTTSLPRVDELMGLSDLDRLGAVSRLRGRESKRYRVDEEIGRGAMGRVLRVQDSDLNRQVAMKVLMGRDEKQVMRFVEEAQISSQLQHPGVLPVHDFGIDSEGEFFFTMQLAHGCESLGDVIARLKAGDLETHATWSFERRVELIQRVCEALHYAHERGVIHRDIKPDNVVVGRNGEVWLVDWGIASVATGPADDDTLNPVTLGTTEDGVSAAPMPEGSVAGTPRYMAPEQIMGLTQEIDAVTDVYSLVAVLYELLSLHHYLGDGDKSLRALIGQITTRAPANAESYYDEVNGRVPRHLSRYCRKGLAKAKGDRYQSALELERDLQLWLEGNAPIVCPGTAMQFGLRRYSDLIDFAPVAVPAATIIAAVLLLAWGVYASLVAVGAL